MKITRSEGKMPRKAMKNSQIWRTSWCSIIAISIFGIASLVVVPATFTYQPVESPVFSEIIYGSMQLLADVSVYQWNESTQPWDRYRIRLDVYTSPNHLFKYLGFHVEFTQDGEVYEWAPIEGYIPGGVVFAIGEYDNDFWLYKVWWPSQQDAMQCHIEVPNDAGLNVRVSVTISYFNCLKEPIEYDYATTGWLNLPDLWPG